MTKGELFEKLNYVDHSRGKRMEMARLVTSVPSLLPLILEIAFEVDDPISARACWVLEFTAKQNLRRLDPHLDLFANGLHLVHLDSSVRPMAKICENLILEHYSTKEEHNPSRLRKHHLELIATACFDWLIGPHKVATKAYSMTCLFHLGKSFAWIHPELRLVIELQYPKGSAAFKARAHQVLPKL